MTHLLHQTDLPAEAGVIGAVMTVLFLAVFLGWTVWAYLPGRKKDFDEASRLPLDDDEGGDA